MTTKEEKKLTSLEKRRIRNRRYYHNNIERQIERKLKSNYGITLELYNQILESQEGKCRICKTDSSLLVKRLAVDHCHQSNLIRGLLCQNCNTAVGLLKDSTDILNSAIKYLEETKY